MNLLAFLANIIWNKQSMKKAIIDPLYFKNKFEKLPQGTRQPVRIRQRLRVHESRIWGFPTGNALISVMIRNHMKVRVAEINESKGTVSKNAPQNNAVIAARHKPSSVWSLQGLKHETYHTPHLWTMSHEWKWLNPLRRPSNAQPQMVAIQSVIIKRVILIRYE